MIEDEGDVVESETSKNARGVGKIS